MNEVTPEYLREATKPKTDQLNADDLMESPLTVSIKSVKPGDAQQRLVVHVDGWPKPYKPCKTMIRLLRSMLGDDVSRWKGVGLKLFRDPEVRNHGEKVGGIRISHSTAVSKPTTFRIQTGRGVRSDIVIYPLVVDSAEAVHEPLCEADKSYVDDVLAEIAAAESTEQLAAIGFILKQKSKAIQDAVRGAYTSKKKALETTTKGETQCGQ